MFESIINNEKNFFSPIKKENIVKAEKEMGIKFPRDLREFYLQVGSGVVGKEKFAINRIIGPMGCADIRLRQDVYEFDPDLDMYEPYEKDAIIFFEFNEGVYALIGIEDGKVYYTNRVIANSLIEFFEKVAIGPDYWTKEN